MKIIKKIKMDLLNKQNIPVIDAVQGDSNTRVLEFSLYSGGIPWSVPDGVSVAVAYLRTDGAKGIYDTLADGSAAISVAGNVVSAILVPQALAVAGDTKLTVVFMADGEQLATFCVTLRVAQNPAIGAVEPEDYINLRQVLVEMVDKVLAEMDIGAPFFVNVGQGLESITVEQSFDDIQGAEASGRLIYCALETADQERLNLPLVKSNNGIFYFSTVCVGVEWLVTIRQGADGNTVATVANQETGSGDSGEDGGYYTPEITDNGDGTMEVSFTPSDADMPAVEPVTVALPAGPAGDTPKKGVDYWTEEDKADIVDAVKAEVPLVKTAEQPTFVNSVDEMTDTSKVYIMPDGYLYAYMEGVEVTKLKSSEFALGQLNTNGVVAAGGNPVRIYTVAALSLENGKISVTPPTGYGYMVYFYNSDTPSENSIVGKTTWITGTVADVTTVNLASGSIDGATHCRFNFRDTASAGALDLTDYFDDFVNAEPIVITSNVKTKRWANTGLAYNQPADYEDRIAALESKLEGLEYGTY